jgi:hypothetical protein
MRQSSVGCLAVLGLFLLAGCRTDRPERLLADTRINGQAVRFAYDTGSEATVLFTRPAKHLGLKIVNPPSSAKAEPGQVLTGVTGLCRLSVGQESYSLRLQTVRLPWPVSWLFDFDGAIGWPDMTDDFIAIDAAEETIRGVEHLPADTNGWSAIPLYRRTGVLALQTPRADGKTGVWEVDTGNDEGISLSPTRWKEWRATRPHGHRGWTLVFMPGSGMGIGWTFTADELSVGALLLKKIPVRKATRTETGIAKSGDVFEGSIGILALRQLNVIIDQKEGTAYLRRRTDAIATEKRPRGKGRGRALASTHSTVHLDFREREYGGLASDAFEAGNFDQALAQVSQFLELQPNNSWALELRGTTRYLTQQWDGAVQDFSHLGAVNTGMANYAQFYVWSVRARMGQMEAATRSLAAYLGLGAKANGDPWETKVGTFLLDRLTEEDFFRAASRESGDKVEHQCEAWYYAGMKRRLAGDLATACDYFRKCVAMERKDVDEYHFATAELRMLR